MYTNTLEIRVVGLMRSGNHAIIEWLMEQHSGHPVCFLNNVVHGDVDPYLKKVRPVLSGIDQDIDREALRTLNKRLLIYSYEDAVNGLRPGSEFLPGVFSADFEANRQKYLGRSEMFIDLLVIRDPFNCIASRMKWVESRRGLEEIDIDMIMYNWKELARRALLLLEDPKPGHVVVKYNRWAKDQDYRRKLSRDLMGKFSDSSMKSVSLFGGGSSFDEREYTVGMALKSWHKVFNPRKWKKIRGVWNRLVTPPVQRMKVLDRWKEYRDVEAFQDVMRDPEILELSERLFGELPGTREYVSDLQATAMTATRT